MKYEIELQKAGGKSWTLPRVFNTAEEVSDAIVKLLNLYSEDKEYPGTANKEDKTMRRIGFTGTSKHALPEAQLAGILGHLHSSDEFHFGDCINADVQAFDAAKALGCWTISHPPINPRLRAFCQADEVRPPKPYLERNHDIVNETEILIAAPRTLEEELRSGTWATIRYARKHGKPVVIVGPGGASKNKLTGRLQP